mmetsp:Transcript_50446/g.162879  ORF Transcript_50446/g.162879 Transcript_50446/m.162879 type:complete len:230 (+) Transcript_50446:138-827(+)
MACSAPAGYVHAVRVGAAGRAAIPRVANLTGAEFAAYDGQLPVIVERGYDAPCLAWTWEKLLAAHGETRFAATAATGKDRQGLAFELAALETMRKHVTPDQWMYVMDETVTQRVPDLLRDCPPPPLLAAEDFFPLLPAETCNAANFRSVIKETVRFHEHENRGRAWPAFEDRGVFATPGPVPPATAEAVFRAFAASIPQDVLAKGQRQLQDEISQVEQTKKERGRKKKK